MSIRYRWRAGCIRRRLQLARYWQSKGDLDEAVGHGRRALRLARAASSGPTLLDAEAALTVAGIELDRAEYPAATAHLADAARWLEQIPETAERDRLLARVLVALADCHRRTGDYWQAEHALGRARPLAEAAGGALPAAVLTQLGITAKELGAFDRAAQQYARLRQLYDETGATPAEFAALSHNLAGLAHARGDYLDAETHARRAVDTRRSGSHTNPVDLAQDLAVLAAALAGQDRHEEARTLLHEALAICRAARPPRQYEIAVQLHNLAAIEQTLGDTDTAERHYRQALTIKERLLGSEHPEIALLTNNLATLLHQQERHAEAVAYQHRALSIATRTFAPEHPVVVAIRRNLAGTDADHLLQQTSPSDVTETSTALGQPARAVGDQLCP
ncbi:tetratricopeptide repeat protein [Nocardia sp. NPDC046473]|uniref:tetratricopeptide repeat protein n=1 Tax=Nocardia sp. NPDC046473 TaxID=3155733 RepID=UPI0033DEE80D